MVAVVLASLVLFPGCSHVYNRNGNVVKVNLARNPKLARTLTSKAAVLLQQEQFEKAEPLLRRAIKADRTYAAAHNNLGLLHFSQFDLFHAALSFQEAMRYDPQSPEPQNNIGLTFEAAGRTEAAIEHYQAAYELSPTDPQFFGNLIRARLRSGEPVESMREELRQLLFIERRPGWIDWIEDQLELVSNPDFDRGPESPELGKIGTGSDAIAPFDESSRVIYDSGPPTSLPASMAPRYEPQSQPTAPAFGIPAAPAQQVQPDLQPTPEFYAPQSGALSVPGSGPLGSIPIRQTQQNIQAGGWEQPVSANGSHW